MEVFTLLKFWRNATGETNVTDFDIRNRPPEIDNDDDSFFDLVLTAPNIELNTSSSNITTTKDNPTICTTTNVHIQSHDNDSKNPLLPHPHPHPHKKNKNNSSKRDGEATTKSNDPHHSDSVSIRKTLPNESVSKPQSPISLLRSPPNFRVFMLSFRKSPSTTPDHTGFDSMSTPKRERSKRFSSRFDDVVPPATFLGRGNTLRSKFPIEKSGAADPAKDGGVVYKYFKMIKPLYARASRIKIFDTAAAAEEKHESSSSSRAVFRNLIKSRMAAAAGGGGGPAPVRRDDSVLQQQDGIQSAILHCKRSYSSSSSSSVISQDCAMLSRSASDSSSMQRAFNQPRRSAEEEKRSSI